MNILKYTKFYFLFSLILLIPGVISLSLYGLNLAIDFTGGSVFIYDFKKDISSRKDELSVIFKENNLTVESMVFENDNRVVIKTKPADSSQNNKLKGEIAKKFDGASQTSFETVGPSVGKDTARKSFIALVVASVGIVLYISYSFRNIPKPYSSFRFGFSAIIAMFHDAFVVLGIFSVLGHFLNVEVDSLFITAILTVIGFSVHDTIVVFDRIRENLSKLRGQTFSAVVNFSVVETLNRSLATSLTVVITLLALYVLGGESIRYFVFALLVGIVSGTYSSIFNAAPILAIWEEYSLRKNKNK